MGKLSGPELRVGERVFQAGDRIVTLAPGAHGQIVTSECGTVLAVDVRRAELAATMDDGRIQRFAGQELDASHLAYGYAVTVHRAQGATVARAHGLADGGGRELAYVMMSRARQSTIVYVVADDLAQALEDLRRSWSQERRVGWAIDRGTPAPQRYDTVATSLHHAELVVERDALRAAIPADHVEREVTAARVRSMQERLDALDHGDGWGVLRGTPVGEAAVEWQSALREWRRCHTLAEDAGLRERHRLLRQADRAAARERPLWERYEALAAPEREQIRAELGPAKERLADLEARYQASLHFGADFKTWSRPFALDRQIEDSAYDLDLDRQDIDGIPPLVATPAYVPAQEWSRGPEPKAPELEHVIELDMW
jgi:hypothetical protein